MSEEKKDPGSPENPPPPTVEEELEVDIKPPVSPRQFDKVEGDVGGVGVVGGSPTSEDIDDGGSLGSIQDEVSLGENSVEGEVGGGGAGVR